MQKVNSGYPCPHLAAALGEGQSEHTFKVTATVDATCTLEQFQDHHLHVACGETKAEEIPALGQMSAKTASASAAVRRPLILSALPA